MSFALFQIVDHQELMLRAVSDLNAKFGGGRALKIPLFRRHAAFHKNVAAPHVRRSSSEATITIFQLKSNNENSLKLSVIHNMKKNSKLQPEFNAKLQKDKQRMKKTKDIFLKKLKKSKHVYAERTLIGTYDSYYTHEYMLSSLFFRFYYFQIPIN